MLADVAASKKGGLNHLMAKRVVDLLVEVLVDAGVQRTYGISDDSLNGITDSIRGRNDNEWVHVRHEETAAVAAGAEGHLTGTLTACAGSCGPGNLHLINGLYEFQCSRVYDLAISAQSPSAEIGSGYFQETHPEHLFAQCSHYYELVSRPEQMPRVLEIAMETAIAKSGVAVIAIPGDVAFRVAVEQTRRLHVSPPKPTVCPSDEEINTLSEVPNRSRNITILGGAGCADAHAELIELAARLSVSTVHSRRGKEFIESNNPFDVGMTGLLGFSSGYQAMMNCHLWLMIGTDFPYRQFFPTNATVVQIDRRGEQIGRRSKVDFGFVGDTKPTLPALLPKLGQSQTEAHLRESLDHCKKARFTCDVGTPTVSAARYLTMNGKRRLLGSFTYGSMANAPGDRRSSYPPWTPGHLHVGRWRTRHAYGRPAHAPTTPTASEADCLQERFPGVCRAGDVGVRHPRFRYRSPQSGLHKNAEGGGLLGLKAEEPEQVESMIAEALNTTAPHWSRPQCRARNSRYRRQSRWSRLGFQSIHVEAVIGGRGYEIIDLARASLFR